jgi:hypothetical protein
MIGVVGSREQHPVCVVRATCVTRRTADKSEKHNTIMNKTSFAVSFVSAIVRAALGKLAAGDSFSSACVKQIEAFNAEYPIGNEARAEKLIEIFGNGEKNDKHIPGTLATTLRAEVVKLYKTANPKAKDVDADAYEAQIAAHVKVRVQRVRNDLSLIRAVLDNSGNPAVIAALPNGLRAAYNARKPKAEKTEKTDDAPVVKPDANPSYSQAYMVALVSQHVDDAIYALRDYLIRAKDSIGIGKVTEIEIHLANKTKSA